MFCMEALCLDRINDILIQLICKLGIACICERRAVSLDLPAEEAVGDGGAGSGVTLCVLEVELHVVAELCGQSVLKALRCSVQSGVLHQLADANGELLAVSRCRSRSCGGGSHGRSSCGGSGRTATGRQSGGGTAGSGGSQERTTSDLTHFDFSPLYIAVRAATGCRTRTAEL